VPNFFRVVLPAAMIVGFVLLAAVALDRPGYYYDEVIFVPVALRVLGQCDVDAAVTVQAGCLPLMQTLGYVGAVKAWLHAPIFAAFGINVWTVRLPSLLVAAAALFAVWQFARRELGVAWALLLLALLATDPVLINHARLDWGPQMIAALMRVVALAALWRWLQTGRMFWLAALCIALLVGFFDKLNFLWVIAALGGATALVAPRLVLERLGSGRPWQPVVAGVTGALLLWGGVTLVRSAAKLDIGGDVAALTAAAQFLKVWNLYAATFSGTSVINWVFGTEAVTTSAFNVAALVQLATAVLLLAVWRPWTPARRLLALLTAFIVLLFLAITVTPQVSGTHHLVMLWPLPMLHLVTLLAILSQHVSEPAPGTWRTTRIALATVGASACGVLLAWNIGWNIRNIDTWQNDRDYRPGFDLAISRLDARLDKLGVERVISVDWGLHQQLVTLADRKRSAQYREWTWKLIDAKDLERDDLRQAVAQHLHGRTVAFVLHAPKSTVLDGAKERLDALLARDQPCSRTDETIVNAAGKPLYVIVVADYRTCGVTAKPP
jgi:Dolichyl-phosphate-mannose-protein mannosyltransferase